MDEKEFRLVITIYIMKGKMRHETKEKIDKRYDDSVPPIRTVYKGFQNFQSGHIVISDAERSDRLLVPSAGKILAIVFCDSQATLIIDYLDKDKTITGAYHVSLLDSLKPELQGKH